MPQLLFAQTEQYSIRTPSIVPPNTPFTLSWQTPSPRTTTQDWVGIYRRGASHQQYITWQYLPNTGTQGTLSFTLASAGEYEARLFTNNSYTVVARSDLFSVSSPSADPSSGAYQLTVPASVPPNTPFTLSWQTPSPRTTTQDWVGIYRRGASHQQYITWQYLPNTGTQGTLSFTLASAGEYEARLFTNNSYTVVARSDLFSVSSPSADPSSGAYQLTVPASVPPNTPFTLSWQTPSPRTTTQDWVGIYRRGASHQQYITWQYLPNTGTQGTLSFTLASAGEYEARLFTNNSYTVVARASTIVEGNIIVEEFVVTPPLRTVPTGSAVSGVWSATSTTIARDWIGLYRTDGNDRSFLAWQYLGVPSGVMNVVVSSPGTYEFRIFKNNSYTRVARSEAIVVIPPPLPGCTIPNLSRVVNYPPRSGPIIAFGDSLTVGVGASAGNDYVSQLSRKANVPIINAGVSGNTTEDALLRLSRDVLSRDPSVVIVLLGGNDALQRYYQRIREEANNPSLLDILRRIIMRLSSKLAEPSGITEEETFENIEEIVRRIQANGAVVILVGFSGGIFDRSLEEGFARVASRTNAIYVPDVLGGIIGRPSLMSDLVHPNDTGYGIVADRILRALVCTLPN